MSNDNDKKQDADLLEVIANQEKKISELEKQLQESAASLIEERSNIARLMQVINTNENVFLTIRGAVSSMTNALQMRTIPRRNND